MIEQNIQAHKKFKILLIGDTCTDVYQYGTVDRISPEAPVPIFVPTYSEERPGMAGNVLNNLQALGCLVATQFGDASKKTRLIDSKSRQQLMRIDQDVGSAGLIRANARGFDAVVISDYDKGFVSHELIKWLIQTAECPIFIDTKKTELKLFNGCYIKINELEYSRTSSLPDEQWLITTHGDLGAFYMDQKFPAIKTSDVIDVTGAGDTFLAALTYGFLSTGDIRQAIVFANRAASVTVRHMGVYAPTLEEIK
jgi:D-beta-D-heptose 7-phosphate kinase/D-beta-D-heptose 1-phosphate adenosyltransferase